MNKDSITGEVVREFTTLKNIEEAISDDMLIWVHRVKEQRVKRSPLNNIKESKDFEAIWQNPRSGYVGFHAVTAANIVVQGTHPGSALCIERSVWNAAKKITSR